MILIKDGKLIANAKNKYKIFILDIAILANIMKINNHKNFKF